MHKNRIILLSLVLMLMLACVINIPKSNPGGTPESSGGSGGSGGTPTAGSTDFSAQASSPQSVLLTWKAVDGATGYNLESGWNGKDFYPLVSLPSSLTQ